MADRQSTQVDPELEIQRLFQGYTNSGRPWPGICWTVIGHPIPRMSTDQLRLRKFEFGPEGGLK